ncbi:hypothetical protein IWW36_003932 [Coemansia brasiliensis]|uniref:C2H2-type domain-containing protein n=1 Tax=Coemansia brasiliensis TaxID=2650707 RepID=A0A9W8I4E9_9FUNG|nr:hypothetical protein IWW36_003932 [Coemansia brasiliensis]
MLPSVRELLAFCDRPSTTSTISSKPQAMTSTLETQTAAEQNSHVRQRPGRKAGCTDRFSDLSGSRPYRCGKRNCGAVFKRPEHLKRHILVHTQERPFQCNAQGCGKRFSRRDNYITHTKKHSREGLRLIINEESNRVAYTSSNASSKRSSSESRDDYESTRASTPLSTEPQSTVSSIFGLLNQDTEATASDHLQSQLPSVQLPSQLQPAQSLDLLAYASTQAGCPTIKQSQTRCISMSPDPVASKAAAAAKRKRVEPPQTVTLPSTVPECVSENPTKPFKCPMCDVCFGRLEHVKRHQLVHTGERQFMCPTCNKSFARKDNMIQHVRAHKRKK